MYPKVLWVFPTVAGNIDVVLPDDIAITSTTANLTYTGIYRNGEKSKFSFDYEDVGGSKGGGQQVGKVAFKGVELVTQQVISFRVATKGMFTIEGDYESERPADKGTFTLEAVA